MLTPPPSDWPNFALTSTQRETVSSLNAAVEEAARQTLNGSAFYQEFGVTRVLVAGSTSRETYGGLPVDFDLAVITERTPIPNEMLKYVSDQIVNRIVQTRWCIAYFKLLTRFLGNSFTRPEIVLESLGLRGKASFVARYVLKPQNPSLGQSVGFLDVTCGNLPHLFGYEECIHKLFSGVGPELGEQLREEIRLAKVIMNELDGIYGAKTRGLRGHALEQLIIQSRKYRPGGLPIGTFDNTMKFLYEEALTSRGRPAPMPFEDFKQKFPLWRPGGNDREGRPVNLWDLVGGGAKQSADEHWRSLLGVAAEYMRCAPDGRSWSIASLALAARSGP